ncbi:hypothetical protein RSAG8_09843, partial [Rhizoctonia solani AG-8 WAC10335]
MVVRFHTVAIGVVPASTHHLQAWWHLILIVPRRLTPVHQEHEPEGLLQIEPKGDWWKVFGTNQLVVIKSDVFPSV